ncbi:proline hydroxylase [Aliikangiella coralliicola]|uniref:Proline hydroxylase n=2 Tax=Aliikangiella coralliicola TaxID=2592383 RepID=A0A545UDW1_9GAMM|nr:proline hydroxylase [Aliikangiella coralliicola]
MNQADICFDSEVYSGLSQDGFHILPGKLSVEECNQLRLLFEKDERFRNTINMTRYGFGQGTYRYFQYPLPTIIQSLRESLYSQLAPIANQWTKRLRLNFTYPEDHQTFLQNCHAQGQTKPTPLILRYRREDYNRLHQDLYGEIAFPFQVIFQLSQPGSEFSGGELVLTEQAPRRQTKVSVINLNQGDAVIIATQYFPRKGSRGDYRVQLKHGVSQIHRGERFSMGIIFHDAK